MKKLNRTGRAIIVRSRRRAAKAHFALFKNLVKAKQKDEARGRGFCEGERALALNGSRRRWET